jgi:hypothetical protein
MPDSVSTASGRMAAKASSKKHETGFPELDVLAPHETTRAAAQASAQTAARKAIKRVGRASPLARPFSAYRRILLSLRLLDDRIAYL